MGERIPLKLSMSDRHDVDWLQTAADARQLGLDIGGSVNGWDRGTAGSAPIPG